MSTVTLNQLAELVKGTISGDGAKTISDVAPLQTATTETISFLLPGTKVDLLKNSAAGAAVVPLDFTCDDTRPLLHVDDVISAFETIVRYFRPVRPEPLPSVSPGASVAPSAKLGNDVRIDTGAVLGEEVVLGDRVIIHSGVVLMAGVHIGADTVIFPNVVIYENCIVGANCILHANSVLGAYGFGYDSSTGQHLLSPQLGNVVLGDNVEIGAGTTIDRGTYSSTLIGDGTKIDNLVMIGHNCGIGKYNLICAHTGIAGSTTTGDYVVMAGRVGVRDHIHIGTGAVLGAMAGIMGSVPEGARVVGIPATPEKEQMKKQVALAKLPEMRKEFRELQTTVARLVQQLAASATPSSDGNGDKSNDTQ